MSGAVAAALLMDAAGGNDSFTKVLLHFDGANGSTTITNSAFGGSTAWLNNVGSIATAQSKFGGSSYDAGAGTGWVDAADSTDFTLGSGDWTVDCWFYRNGGDGGIRNICSQGDNAASASAQSLLLQLNSSNVLLGGANVSTTINNVTGTTAITTTGWHHAALVRTGNTLKMFLDGVQEGGNVAISGTVNDSANRLSVGRYGEFSGVQWNGWIDEFRLSVGIARWTANFTPPTQAYS